MLAILLLFIWCCLSANREQLLNKISKEIELGVKLRTKNANAILLAFLILTSTLLISLVPQVYAETLFTDNYETNNYSKWTDTVDTGSTMGISPTTVFEGRYSADCNINGTVGTYAYAYKNLLSTPSVLYHREYIRVSALPQSGAETDLFGIMNGTGSGVHLGTLAIRNSDGTILWKLEYYNNGVPAITTAPATIKANTWYYVEIMVKSGSGNGQVDVWIAEDKTSVNEASPTIHMTGLNNNDRPIGAAFFGGYVTGASYPVHIYSDSVVLSSTWTGPRDFTSPIIGAISATSHSTGAQVTISTSITDDFGIDYVIPSWNNTGTWVNQTALDASDSKSFTATLTGTWNSAPKTVVSVIFYAYDTSNNGVASSKTDFALNTYVVTLSADHTSVTQEDTVSFTLGVTKNGLSFSNFVANASRDGSLFASNVTSFTDKAVSAVSHLYTVSSLCDDVTGESVAFTSNSVNIVWAKSTYVVTLSANQTSVTQGDTVSFTLGVAKNGLSFSNFIANLTRDGSLFASNVISFTDSSGSIGGHFYAISSLYDLTTSESVDFTSNSLNVIWAATPAATPAPTAAPTVAPTATPKPTAKPTATPSVNPSATATPSPTTPASPEPTATITPSPLPTQEGLSTVAIIGIVAVIIVAVAIALLLLIRRKR